MPDTLDGVIRVAGRSMAEPHIKAKVRLMTRVVRTPVVEKTTRNAVLYRQTVMVVN